MSKFAEIEKLNRATLTLIDGSVVTGTSWGIEDALDDEGESLGFDILVFELDNLKNPIELKEEDIVKVEKAS